MVSAVVGLFSSTTQYWAAPWIAVAFAAFYLLLMRLPAQGVLQANSPALSGLHLAAAVVFLTIAIPLKTHGRWMTIGWLVEGEFTLVDGGSPLGRWFLGTFAVGRSFLAMHVKITDVDKGIVVYEFDLAGGSRGQGGSHSA